MNEVSILSSSPLRDVIEHWARSRIDTPLSLIGRYDEGARQVLALAATLQGAYVAILSFGDFESSAPTRIGWFVVVLLIPAMFFALRCICTVSPKMEAMNAYKLVERVASHSATAADVKLAIQEWCSQVDDQVARKRRLLHGANLSFLFGSSLAALVILLMVIP